MLLTGQHPARVQRKDRYTRESVTHPAKMLPAIAAQVITAYSQPGDLVVDPMCGIGTTLVEAVHQGRDAAGTEYEPNFCRMAAENLRHARSQRATGTGTVVCGDARNITTLLADHIGQAALVLTSPPYGAWTHGHVRTHKDGGQVEKTNHRYSHNRRDRANLANSPLPQLMDGFTQILTACTELLAPGGIIAVTIRPIRYQGELVDLPGQVVAAAEAAGLVLVERIAALLCGIRQDHIVTRTSFFQQLETRRLRERGVPAHATAHEDLLVFQRAREMTRWGELDHHREVVRPCGDPIPAPVDRPGRAAGPMPGSGGWGGPRPPEPARDCPSARECGGGG